MIIIKCDNCKKVIDNIDLQKYQYNYRRYDDYNKILCDVCKVHLSQRYDKKYHSLQIAHNLLQEQFKQVKKECAAFKKLKKEDLLARVKLRIDA